MDLKTNILVIGAGIAGATVCYWLKKYGFSPTLIERSRQPRVGGYDIDVRGSALGIVKKMGLYEDLCKKRTSLLSTRYVNADGRTLAEEYDEKVHFTDGDDVELLRGDLVAVLLQAIRDVPCHFGKEIIRLEQASQSVDVTFKDGQTEQYDLVIAADGLHSSTRKLAFSDRDYQFVNLGYYYSIFSIPNYLKLSRSKVSFTKDQKIISVDSDKNPETAFVSIGIRSNNVLKDISNEIKQKQRLKDWCTDLGWETNKILELMHGSRDFYFDVMAQVKMQSWHKERVALLGDAAYCASPFSGMGINLALVGAYILAGELKLSGGDYSVAFKRYNELVHPFVDAVQDLAVWMGECFLPEVEISKEILEQRSCDIIEKIKVAANAISLPDYA